MKKLSRILAIILALSLLFTLAACGNKTSDEETPAPQASESEPTESGEDSEGSNDEQYVIGICQLMQHDALDAATQGFMDTLTEKLGNKVTFDLQNAQGDSATCSTIVTGFVSNNYDLILANATPALQAAISATSTIPILGTSVTDYATALADDSMDATVGTGINVSGSSDGVDAQLYADLTMELVPEAKKVAVLYCSAEANSVVQADNYVAAMKDKGVECTVSTFADSNDLQAVCTSAIEGVDAMYIPTDNTAASNMTIVQSVCEPAKLPIICGEENMTANGGLATVSISYYDIGVLCGEQAYEILVNGADVSTMPIAYSTDPVKKYNSAYAEAIGFTMPEGFEEIVPAAE